MFAFGFIRCVSHSGKKRTTETPKFGTSKLLLLKRKHSDECFKNTKDLPVPMKWKYEVAERIFTVKIKQEEPEPEKNKLTIEKNSTQSTPDTSKNSQSKS